MDTQTTLPEALNTVLNKGLATTAPAIALAVIQRGTMIVNCALGQLDPDASPDPARPESRFDLASVTKLFTATAFLQQAAEGKIGLHVPITSVIPEFGRYGPRPIDGGQDPHTLALLPPEHPSEVQIDPRTVTFYHLLTHTGGLAPWRDLFRNVGSPPPPPGEPDPLFHAERMARALDLIAGYPFVGLPGQAVRYSDLGLILLGEAVRRLDGAVTLADVIAARITGPLDLTRTGYRPSDPADCAATEYDARWRGRRCRGEVHDENAAALGGIAGHAGLFSTAADVARFGQWWLEALTEGVPALPRQFARQATRRHAGDRGLGWVLKSMEGYSSAGAHLSPDSFGHTGFTGTSLWIDPDRQLVAALLTNRVYHGRDPEAITVLRPRVMDALCVWLDTATR
ncbi:MAG: hypothetical protein Kow0077_11320 [Anaerolineae bacterium]